MPLAFLVDNLCIDHRPIKSAPTCCSWKSSKRCSKRAISSIRRNCTRKQVSIRKWVLCSGVEQSNFTSSSNSTFPWLRRTVSFLRKLPLFFVFSTSFSLLSHQSILAEGSLCFSRMCTASQLVFCAICRRDSLRTACLNAFYLYRHKIRNNFCAWYVSCPFLQITQMWVQIPAFGVWNHKRSRHPVSRKIAALGINSARNWGTILGDKGYSFFSMSLSIFLRIHKR